MDRKKEYKNLYKQMRPQMGIMIIRSQSSGKCYIKKASNLKGQMNSAQFQLEAGSHPNRELQKEWREHGPADFSIEILDQLEYAEDESKTDYAEELTLLQLIWEERLRQENKEVCLL